MPSSAQRVGARCRRRRRSAAGSGDGQIGDQRRILVDRRNAAAAPAPAARRRPAGAVQRDRRRGRRRSRRVRIFTSVLLPAPLAPSSAWTSPGRPPRRRAQRDDRAVALGDVADVEKRKRPSPIGKCRPPWIRAPAHRKLGPGGGAGPSLAGAESMHRVPHRRCGTRKGQSDGHLQQPKGAKVPCPELLRPVPCIPSPGRWCRAVARDRDVDRLTPGRDSARRASSALPGPRRWCCPRPTGVIMVDVSAGPSSPARRGPPRGPQRRSPADW